MGLSQGIYKTDKGLEELLKQYEVLFEDCLPSRIHGNQVSAAVFHPLQVQFHDQHSSNVGHQRRNLIMKL